MKSSIIHLLIFDVQIVNPLTWHIFVHIIFNMVRNLFTSKIDFQTCFNFQRFRPPSPPPEEGTTGPRTPAESGKLFIVMSHPSVFRRLLEG